MGTTVDRVGPTETVDDDALGIRPRVLGFRYMML